MKLDHSVGLISVCVCVVNQGDALEDSREGLGP